MSIKNIAHSLNMSILLRMIIAIIISLLVFFLLLNFSEYIAAFQNSKFHDTKRDEINSLASEIKEIVETENLTLVQARNSEFVSEDSAYTVYFFSYEENELYDEYENSYASKLLDDQQVFDINFFDVDGFLVINSHNIEFTANVYYVISGVITVLIFSAIALFLIFEELSYIKTIEKGIKKISKSDILHKIPIVGKNELASLAQSINLMGDNIHNRITKEREDEISQRLLITNLSHDLRTPLTSINGYLDIAKSKLTENEELYSYINIARENGVRLEKLINDLFLYSRLISGDVPTNLQKLDVNIVLGQVLEMRVENIDCQYSNEELISYIDAEKFHRIIDNLISNAVKYGRKNGEISIKTDMKNDEISISIKNFTDEKISDKISMLTKRMYIADNNGKKDSSGLGLSIVFELVKILKGKFEINFENEVFEAVVKLPRG